MSDKLCTQQNVSGAVVLALAVPALAMCGAHSTADTEWDGPLYMRDEACCKYPQMAEQCACRNPGSCACSKSLRSRIRSPMMS